MYPVAYDLEWNGESTPKLHRGKWEPEEKEPNVIVDTGELHGACYMCNRQTNIVVVFSPYPKMKEMDRDVKPYRIRICAWCAIAHKLVQKVVT